MRANEERANWLRKIGNLMDWMGFQDGDEVGLHLLSIVDEWYQVMALRPEDRTTGLEQHCAPSEIYRWLTWLSELPGDDRGDCLQAMCSAYLDSKRTLELLDAQSAH